MRIDILGIGFDKLTLSAAVGKALAMTEDGLPHYIVTPNPEIVQACLTDSEKREAVLGAGMVLADGIGIVKASVRLGRPLPERVAGFDFACALMPELAKRGKRLFLLGSKPGIAERAAERLRENYPGLLICGTCDGYFNDDGAVTRQITESKADVVYVCLGPGQEVWMARNTGKAGSSVMVGLGGSIDHWAGVMKRAPLVFRRLGLEWLYRFIRYPSRLRRFAAIPRFLRAVGKQRKEERMMKSTGH